MSGHSKWATIKRQKGVADVKRGQVFTKIAKAIILAVRSGGGIGDPEQNFKLRLAVEKARSMNMPKDNIERAIEKGRGKADLGEEMQETVYEGFGIGGVSLIVEAATDNKIRTTSEVKSIFDKNGGNVGVPGAVAYQFQQKGLIAAKKEEKTVDEIFLIAADCGAEDIEDSGDSVLIYTKPEELAVVKDSLSRAGITITEAELTRRAVVTVPIHDKETADRLLAFIDKLENHDDVQKVYANFDIPEIFIQ